MDVARDRCVSLCFAGIHTGGFLLFKCGKKALCYGVIPAVTLATHALYEASFHDHAAKTAACVLGGFNRSSQHWIVVQTLNTHSVLRQVFSSLVFFEV